jgi:uncharacterized protein (DUF2141 family)
MMFQVFKLLMITHLLAGINAGSTPPEQGYELRLQLQHIMISKGTFYIAIYNNEKEFMKNAYMKKSVPADQPMSMQVNFDNLPAGDYSVTIFQDLNGNGKLDKLFNLPTEPYGLSNNPVAFPTYENTRVHIDKNTLLKIKIKN